MVGVKRGPTPAKTESQARVKRLFTNFLNLILILILLVATAAADHDGLMLAGGADGR